jgi:hypothetical protein
MLSPTPWLVPTLWPLETFTPLEPPLPTLAELEFEMLAESDVPLDEFVPQLDPWFAPADVPDVEPLDVLPPTNPRTPPFMPLAELSACEDPEELPSLPPTLTPLPWLVPCDAL